MHIIVIDLQEANKDVLLGKRNFNCLSCGVKDGASQAPTAANSAVHGKDGRVYRGNQGEQTTEVSSPNTQTSRRYHGRVSSANPHSRAHRMTSISSSNEAFNIGTGTTKVTGFGMATEARMR